MFEIYLLIVLMTMVSLLITAFHVVPVLLFKEWLEYGDGTAAFAALISALGLAALDVALFVMWMEYAIKLGWINHGAV